MYAMFIKEMQQFFRGIVSKIIAGLIFFSWLMVLMASQFEVPELEELKRSDVMTVLPNYQIFIYSILIIGVGALILIITLGSSAGRWRMELGDPAFSPGITTCTPAWQLALGKWGALMTQTMTGVVAGCLIPLKIFLELNAVQNLIGMVGALGSADLMIAQLMAEIEKFGARVPVSALCIIVTLTSTSLAVCSLKPRSRGKFDIGSLAVILLLGVQSLTLTIGIRPEHFVVDIIVRTVIISVGSLSLISSGVSAPGANRLSFFKAWAALSVFVLLPVTHRMTGGFSREIWAAELLIAGLFFIGCSLFERLIQSRRVLAQMSNPLMAIVAFPLSTGALNSMVLSGIFMLAAYKIFPGVFDLISDLILLAGTLASLCNLAGFLFEKYGKRFIRFAAFIGGAWIIGFVAGWLNVNHPGSIEENRALIRGTELLLTAISLLVLAINYNSRKKDL